MANEITITYAQQGMEILHPTGSKQVLSVSQLTELRDEVVKHIAAAQKLVDQANGYLSKATVAAQQIGP